MKMKYDSQESRLIFSTLLFPKIPGTLYCTTLYCKMYKKVPKYHRYKFKIIIDLNGLSIKKVFNKLQKVLKIKVSSAGSLMPYLLT